MSDVTTLIARFKEGSRSAYHCLFAAYFPGLVSTVGRHLRHTPFGIEDAEDVALNAFMGLWQEVADGRAVSDGLTDRGSLLRTLALLAAQNARRARRDARRQKRDARRTVRPVDHSPHAPVTWDELSDPSPGPDRRALFRESLADALARLTPLQRAIVEQKLAGHTNPEIARHVGRSVRTVERQLSEVRSLWTDLRPADGDLPCREAGPGG